jgi:hypothetical protein
MDVNILVQYKTQNTSVIEVLCLFYTKLQAHDNINN